ncbi:hypothetical protein VTL71DRAFT_4477 [Oculimacula yallundae]|uniref:BTB domain transcription factor n=1 Tax=Oculimacula yallundae TaxID=86028 RepID=A0ABR4C4H8_9HELO
MWKKGLITTGLLRRYSTRVSANTPETAITKNGQGKTDAGLENTNAKASSDPAEEKEEAPKRQKTILEQDEELRLKLEGISGGGGGAGVEYEGGKARFQTIYTRSSISSDTFKYKSNQQVTQFIMASTRSSQGSSPAPTNGVKRAAEGSASPPAKRGRGRPKKQQKTLEETGGVETSTKDQNVEGDAEATKKTEQDATPSQPAKRGRGRPKKAQDESKGTNGSTKNVVDDMDIDDDESIAKQIENGDKANDEKNQTVDGEEKNKAANGEVNGEKNAFDEIKADEGEVKKAADEEQEAKSKEIERNNNSVVEDDKREAAVPSSILEKGIIYFFFRGRVGVEEPQGIEDVARSYIVLRPLPLGAKLGEGPLEDSGNARLLALPKKMLPKSRQDRFLVFVENPSATIKDLREQFSSNDYATKTSGTSHTPSATPLAEGIYAITSTGRESHLAYLLTVPSSVGEIQKELGLNEKGSFVVSAKNPNAPGPANATLDNPAKYPSEIQDKFRNLRWMPLEPSLLGYQNTQFLLIGEGMGDLGNAVQEMSKDAKDDEKEKPVEELEKLEEEDHDRVEGLKGDDPIFADLGLSGKEFEKLQTTW